MAPLRGRPPWRPAPSGGITFGDSDFYGSWLVATSRDNITAPPYCVTYYMCNIDRRLTDATTSKQRRTLRDRRSPR